MSYARFGPDCDVYVYLDVAGYLNCCGCRLQDHRVVENDGSALGWHTEPSGVFVQNHFTTTADMLGHLDSHRRTGHAVPESVDDALDADSTENDAWMQERSS